MSENSKIEWTDHTFNPVRGCTKISPGCANCYAEKLSHRNPKVLGEWGPGAPRVVAKEAYWREPVKWNAVADSWRECTRCGHRDHMAESCPLCGCDTAPARQRVFCASLSDWLDEEWPIEALARLLALIHATPGLDWMLLTKRPGNWESRLRLVAVHLQSKPFYYDDPAWRMIDDWLPWNGLREDIIPPTNVWIGTTVEDQMRANERIPTLLAIPARLRFLSCEPLLGPVDLGRVVVGEERIDYDPLRGKELPGAVCRDRLHWVICGGESGPGARPMHPAWAPSLRDQCKAAGVPFFFKQWGEWLPNNQSPFEKVLFPNKLARTMWGAGAGLLSGDGSVSIRVGKHAAGRLLDGAEHRAFPLTAGGRPDED